MRLAALAVAVLAAAGCASTHAHDHHAAPAPEAAPAPRDPAAEQAAWMKYMTPGEEHARMARESGTWDCSCRIWMEPGQPPMEMKSTAEMSMIMGGRYQRMDYKGEMMGMPFDGLALNSFDNADRQYRSVWIDSMGTGMMMMKGKADAAGVLHMTGEMVDPMGGTCAVREELIPGDADTFTMKMFMTKPGQPESQMMEIVFRRRK